MTRSIKHLVATVIAATLFAGCMSHMDDDGGRIGRSIASARAETTLHTDRSIAALTLVAVMDELSRHESAMGGRLEELHGALEDPYACGRGMKPMHDRAGELERMLVEHAVRMRAADSIEDARDEARAHGESVHAMLDSMDVGDDEVSCMTDPALQAHGVSP